MPNEPGDLAPISNAYAEMPFAGKLWKVKKLTLDDIGQLEQYLAEAPLRQAWAMGREITPEIRAEVDYRSLYHCRSEWFRISTMLFGLWLAARWSGVVWDEIKNLPVVDAAELRAIHEHVLGGDSSPPATGATSSAAP